jgi:ABC-type bacteriocin/lantibiotic exporter with double-glycine peptidase domain
VPEVVQTSGMDCGPASLKCLLEGFHVPVSYGRLREACQTDVDGTNIDTIEEIAVQLGLDAEQIMVPPDHLLRSEAKALPALVVVRLPNNFTHFVVVWRRHGSFLQIMDPAAGRRWVKCERFFKEIFIHKTRVPASQWREWAGSDDFLNVLRARIIELGVSQPEMEEMVRQGLSDSSWYSLAKLDAATRMVSSLVEAGGIKRGEEAARILENLKNTKRSTDSEELIPSEFWTVVPSPKKENDEGLILSGAVLIRVKGVKSKLVSTTEDSEEILNQTGNIPQSLLVALKEQPVAPGRKLLEFLRLDGRLVLRILALGFFLAAGGMMFEAMLFLGLFDISQELNVTSQRIGAVLAFLVFVIGLTMLELPLMSTVLALGRRLEGRLRIAFLEKIPLIKDCYFHSRLVSDMAERSHLIHKIRLLPEIGWQAVRHCFELLLTIAGIFCLDVTSGFIALLGGVSALGVQFLFQPLLVERELRLRTHSGALTRFYLDGLLGLVPIRTHRAERALRSQHEELVDRWKETGLSFQRVMLSVEAIPFFIGITLTGLLLWDHFTHANEFGGTTLLLLYWALNIPVIAQKLLLLVQQYPSHRNIALRLFEILGAPQTSVQSSTKIKETPFGTESSKGIEIAYDKVSVHAGGHSILENIGVTIKPGSHVAIVGASGAGKSSFVGLLLGWNFPSSGRVLVNGRVFDDKELEVLRRKTAWVDPEVQLWNESLSDNLLYGSFQNDSKLDEVVRAANLKSVLEKLSNGFQTPLGEGGKLVSGGEGQRVRFARALLRSDVELVILDEAFRGLDRLQRKQLLQEAQTHWRNATLLCVTHDIRETASFERVLVFDGGRIVEDGNPAALVANRESRYSAMLQAEERLLKQAWASDHWNYIRMNDQGSLEKEARLSL